MFIQIITIRKVRAGESIELLNETLERQYREKDYTIVVGNS